MQRRANTCRTGEFSATERVLCSRRARLLLRIICVPACWFAKEFAISRSRKTNENSNPKYINEISRDINRTTQNYVLGYNLR